MRLALPPATINEEEADVWATWRDMLKDELFKSHYTKRPPS